MRWCCPFVCRSVDETRTRKRNFLKKTTLLWSLLTTNWTIPRWTFQRSDCWTHKIQDGGCPPYWKSFLAMNQQPIVRFQWNFVWGSCFSLNLGSSQKTGPARLGPAVAQKKIALVITAVDFDQFSLYSTSTVIIIWQTQPVATLFYALSK